MLAERQGSAVLHLGNRDHVAWVVVEALAGLRWAALDKVRAELEGWTVAPVTALCFGSFARGDGDEDSDIDVLLVRPAGLAGLEQIWERQQQALRERVRRTTGNDCQVLDIDLARLLAHVELGDTLVINWLHDGLLLAGVSMVAAISLAHQQTALR